MTIPVIAFAAALVLPIRPAPRISAFTTLSVSSIQWAGSLGSYDPAKEVRIRGEVQETELVRMPDGLEHLLVVVAQAEGKTIRVLVGPTAFLARKRFFLARGYRVSVLGSRVGPVGEERILARELAVGDRKLTLREIGGRPMWKEGVKGGHAGT